MSGMNISKLLEELMKSAKKIGKTENAPFTAERFLVAVMDRMAQSEEKSDELSAVELIMREMFENFGTAREGLMEYICRPRPFSFSDDLYMKKKLQLAFELEQKSGGKELRTISLLRCIQEDPSEGMKEVLNGSGMKKDSSTAPEKADVSEEKKNTNEDIYLDVEPKHCSEEETFSKAKTPSPKATEKPKEQNVKGAMSSLLAEVKRVRETLHGVIFGQDKAINVFTTGYFQASLLSMIDKSKKRPRASFLFAGPPGVGKTFLAEKAAEALGLPFMRFDMSEYCEKEAALEFCGSDAVYKNNKQGNFTSFISKNPKCVVLLDEIEKAHISIIHLFLQVLDAGRLRDSNTDREISFKDVILIFTTNAGKQLYLGSEDSDLSSISRKVIIDALEKDVNPETGVPYFPGAICSRFASGNVVMFNHITAPDLRLIAKNEIEKQAKNLKNEMGINMELDETVYTALLFSEGTKADARTTRSRAESFFNVELYELLRLISSEKAKTEVDDVETIRIVVDTKSIPADIAELFSQGEAKRMLVLADEKDVALCASKNPRCEVIGVQTGQAALEVLKKEEIAILLLDVNFGIQNGSASNLNVEDAQTPARELLHTLHEQRKFIPVYLLEHKETTLDEEEKISFERQGIRGFLKLTEDREDGFADTLNAILSVLHQQESMIKLARENKLISFETSQSVSDDGKIATIELFDFKATVAVDSEDSGSILSSVSRPNVRFDDVIGANDAKKELNYFVEYLRNPKKYMGTGVKAPKGMLLYGPPGTGKTMLAKAMASEAGVTYIAAEGNQFLKSYVGEGAEKVHELFRTARKYAPSVLFIDEIDAIAKERRGTDGASSETEATLTSFLTEMDGFVNDPSRPVFVLAATNFDVEPGGAKSLDPALMRRFDRRVYIDLPNKEDRAKFLRMKIEKNQALKISETQVENIAMRSTGMSLADLDSVVELALRSAIREGSTVVTDAILEEAFETFNGGEAKKWDASQLERVARHEAGHAFLCWLSGETPSYLTIVARGNHGGYMQHAEQEGKGIYTKDELLARIRVSLGGRAAEIAYYGERDGISTGASGDLASATGMAQQIVCTYGMDDVFGLAVVNARAASDGTMSVEVRAAVNKILKEQMEKAVQLISENKDKIDSLVEELMNKNHLNGAEIDAAIKKSVGADASRIENAE